MYSDYDMPLLITTDAAKFRPVPRFIALN